LQLKKWVAGVYGEIEFWRVWMRTRGAFWRKDYARRLQPDVALDAQAAQLLPTGVASSQIRVLDVGSGPLSGLGVTHNGERLDIIAADPLASAYQRMYQEFKVEPQISVKLAFAEDLSAFFQNDEFDLVVCQNALDHTFDPWRALRQMIEVSKPGGFVLLRHARNEAVSESYSGLHQWNLDTNSDGDFIIWNEHSSVNVNQLLAGRVDVRVLESAPEHIVVTLSKSPGTVFFDAADSRARLRELLVEMSDTAVCLGREGLFMRACFAFSTYTQYAFNKLTGLF
jgi:SAM-dependent methyltransferase